MRQFCPLHRLQKVLLAEFSLKRLSNGIKVPSYSNFCWQNFLYTLFGTETIAISVCRIRLGTTLQVRQQRKGRKRMKDNRTAFSAGYYS